LGRILGPQHRQLFGRPIGKGPEQNRIQRAEHGGVGADRQCQCGGSGHRKHGTSAKGAKPIRQVTREIAQPHERPHLPDDFLGLRDATEIAPGRLTRVLDGKALPDVRICGFCQMARDLVVDVAIQLTSTKEGP
jgi:hypothetical protein